MLVSGTDLMYLVEYFVSKVHIIFVISFSTLSSTQGPSDECSSNTFSRVFSPVGQEAILSALNEVRRKVAHGQQWGQPPAANMKKVVGITW